MYFSQLFPVLGERKGGKTDRKTIKERKEAEEAISQAYDGR